MKKKRTKHLNRYRNGRGLNSDTKNSTPPVESSSNFSEQLSQEQAEVLHLMTNEYLTVKQISIRRGCSASATYKIASKLKKKGLLSPILSQVPGGLKKSKVLFNPPINSTPKSVTTVTRQIRLHGQEFNINLLFKDQRYKALRKKSNILYIEGNTIKLYNNSIEVYSGVSFYADSVHKATVKSMSYFTRLFGRLEHDLNVILIKDRYQNIKLVNQHYAEVNNELSEECEKKAEKIRVYAREDGKLWFTIDNSFNLHEAETQHPDTGQKDMETAVRPFFNDLRENNPPTLSAIMKALNESAAIHKESASGLNTVIKLLKPAETEPKENLKHIPEYIG